jgi:hypothetical protein
MFDPKSRYARLVTYRLRDVRGREVEVVPAAPAPAEPLLGIHARKDGERIDHLAARYLADPAGYWRVAEINDAMTADVLTDAGRIQIPARRR